MLKNLLLLFCVLTLVCLTLLAVPITSGTVFLEKNIVTEASPSSFGNLVYAGTGNRVMFDRRPAAFVTYNAFLFNATFTDGPIIEIQINPEFSTPEAAAVEAEKYARVAGQLPAALRARIRTMWIHKGLEPFGGGNDNILIHTGQADEYVASGVLEETFVHESTHTSLDPTHGNSVGWLAAQTADADFISTYARDNPTREDVAESFLPYVALRYRSDRISAGLSVDILRTIPNRIQYFDGIPLDMFPLADQTVNGGSALITSTPGNRNLRAGFSRVDVKGGSAPSGIAVLSITQNGTIVSEAGVPSAPVTQQARVFVDYRNQVASGNGSISINTGLAIAHPGTVPATLTLTLRDRNGTTLTSAQGTLSAGAHLTKFLTELRDIAPGFTVPSNFPSTIGFGSLEVASSQPVSITALRLTTNQRGETLLSTTPIADTSVSSAVSAVEFPHLADGGGYSTTFILLNATNFLETGTITILDDAGAPLSVRDGDGRSGSTFQYSIPARGTFEFHTDGSPALVSAGWARISPTSGGTPTGAGVFSYVSLGTLVTESGIPAAVPTTRARVYVDLSSNHDTGIALANPGTSTAIIDLRVFQKDGVTPAGNAPASVTIPSGGHRAAFAGQLIEGLPSGFSGVLEMTSSSSFAALTLRSLVNSRGDFLLTTFPVADGDRPSASSIVFPQIADGGGYSTQFIFINAARTAGRITLNLFGDDHAPFSITPFNR